MKIDPYNNKEKYLAWKAQSKDGITNMSPGNSEIILKYLHDMEKGINISSISAKGSRSYTRLVALRDRMIFFSNKFSEISGIKCMTEISEEQLIEFFADMKNGIIKKNNGGDFKSVDTYARIFRAFWHWYQKACRKKGLSIQDITLDLDTKEDKPDWVYLTEKEIRTLCDNAKPAYKVLIIFLFDTGIRSPTELMNIKVSDFFNNFKELNIREETSKTFGRRIKIMLCSEILKEYVNSNNLQPEDYIFKINPANTNKYLKRLAKRMFGDKQSPAGQRYSELTMYDFRHCSCCYWLPRYKSESALKYRFGWKKSDRIHYYSELLGMKDTISEEDLLIDVTKTEIEQRLTKTEKEKIILHERVNTLEMQMGKIMGLVKQLEVVQG